MFESWPFSITPIQKDRRTPARNEIDRLQPGGVPLPDHIGGNVRAAGVGLDPARIAPATGILLGRDERDRWEEIMTQVVKDPAGQMLLPALEKLVQSPMYLGSKDKPTSDLRKRELLSHKIDWFKERAEEQLLKERPDLHAAVRGQQIEKRIQMKSPWTSRRRGSVRARSSRASRDDVPRLWRSGRVRAAGHAPRAGALAVRGVWDGGRHRSLEQEQASVAAAEARHRQHVPTGPHAAPCTCAALIVRVEGPLLVCGICSREIAGGGLTCAHLRSCSGWRSW